MPSGRDAIRMTPAEIRACLDEAISEQVRASIAKRVLLRFTAFRHVSRDHGNIAGFH